MSVNNDFIVDVVMVTYNQENFIREAIESVLMQKTNFAYRLIIGEDCSTDNTRKICLDYVNKYSGKIELILHDKNQGLLNNYKSIFDSCTAKYIAILEGDDYWNDENKLQKQVDFLENNSRYGLVHTDCEEAFYKEGQVVNVNKLNKKEYTKDGYVFESLLKNNFIHPLTVMFKKELYDKYISIDCYIKKDFKTLDYPMWLDISNNCEIYFQDFNSASYRIHCQSITHTKDNSARMKFHYSNYLIKKNAIEKYDNNKYHLIQLENKFKVEQLILEISFRNYKNIHLINKEFKVYDIKSFLLKIISSKKMFVYLYSKLIEIRQKNIL